MSDGAHHPEIIIVRRGGHGDHDDHHGGVWKIAFADFMTAMMAFFLVMWLISANDKTRASVARYFNPVKLVDATTQPRGLNDPKKDDSGITAASAPRKDRAEKADKTKSEGSDKNGKQGAKEDAKQDAKTESAAGREARLDKKLAENPYAALAEIVAAKGPGEAPRDAKASRAPVIGLRGGEQFRDPFAPPSPPPRSTAEERDEAVAAITPADLPPPSPPEAAPRGQHGPAQQAAETRAADKAEAAQLAAALKTGGRDGAGPAVDVKRTAEGLLVSLTDTADFAMFSSGSAVPSRRVVLMMEHVAAALKGKPGTIVVRGYTDNKPFHGTRYDNWHLSLDRAQVTHYMLVRGGLADARIGHVEGYADRQARAGLDPASPLNRRIEILLQDPPGPETIKPGKDAAP